MLRKQVRIFIFLILSLGLIFQINTYNILSSQILVSDFTCVFKTYKTVTLSWTNPKDESSNEIKNLSIKVQQATNDGDWKYSTLCNSDKELALKNSFNDICALTVIGLDENTEYKFRLAVSVGTSTTYSNEISVVTAAKNNNNKFVEFPDNTFQQSITQAVNKTNEKLVIQDINELRYLNVPADSIKSSVGIQFFQSLDHLNNFKAEPKDGAINLSWNNPKTSNFNKVIIVRKLGYYPVNQNDGIKIYEGNATSYIDKNASYGQFCYYRAFLYNKDGQVSFSTFGNLVSNEVKGLYFNGTGAYVTFPGLGNIALSKFTIIVKFNIPRGSSTMHTVFSNAKVGGDNHGSMIQECNGSIAVWENGEPYKCNQTSCPISYDKNTCFAFSYDIDNKTNLRLYTDGEFKVSRDDIGWGGVNTNTSFIGKSNQGITSTFWGTMSEFQVWGRQLSDSEILHFSQNSPTDSDNKNGLLVYYDFAEGSGTVLHNKGNLGSGFDGQIYNASWFNK